MTVGPRRLTSRESPVKNRLAQVAINTRMGLLAALSGPV